MNLKRRKKKSLAQQSKQILILMTVILVIILGGCTYVLNKTSGQIYEQMSQMAQLYAQELDNRFLRISRNLFSTIMDTNEIIRSMRSENSEKNIFLRHGNMERNTGFFYTHMIRINYISFPCLRTEITQCHLILQHLSVNR